ncbi:MAG: alpha-ketoglutarate-dependent dioxygenase AlkB [Gammaproteobacteria bacterium]|nr:alpha-ketoglutarate-dependent dioxygenase AlkB [Gammaproteobacteria bacterium]
MQIDLFTTEFADTPKLPSCVQYWPALLSKPLATEAYLRLVEEVIWRQPEVTVFGKTHLIPRLQSWMADQNVEYGYSDHQLVADQWHPEVIALKRLVETTTGFAFNSVLLNYYRDGDDKMGWHADDERELGSNPAVATLSLGAERDFQIRHNTSNQTHSIALGHGSLLLMKPGMQASYKHQLPTRKKVNAGRISLTFRYVY